MPLDELAMKLEHQPIELGEGIAECVERVSQNGV
jgi:hypothetical protein